MSLAVTKGNQSRQDDLIVLKVENESLRTEIDLMKRQLDLLLMTSANQNQAASTSIVAIETSAPLVTAPLVVAPTIQSSIASENLDSLKTPTIPPTSGHSTLSTQLEASSSGVARVPPLAIPGSSQASVPSSPLSGDIHYFIY